MFGFLSKEEKRKKQLSKSHVYALWEILRADGKTHAKELEMLYERAKFHKLSKKEVDEVTIEADAIGANKEDFSFIKPETKEDQFHFIYDLTCMMMVDGDIDYREKEACKDYAIKLGLKRELIDDLIENISQSIGDGNDLNESYRKLYKIIKNQNLNE